MNSTTPVLLGLVSLSLVIACEAPSSPSATSAPSAAAPETGESEAGKKADAEVVAAKVGDREILVSEIDAAIESSLRRLETQRYQARKQQLDQMIQSALLEEEAKEQGVPVNEILEREVQQKAPAPSDEEVRAYYDQHKEQLGGTWEALEPRIRQGLHAQAQNARRQEYLASLREDAEVTVNLDAPRVKIDTASGVGKGPEGAPITLVEFSDFQCPFCARSQETVDHVLEKYGDKIHHVFMDFPLQSIHPQAMTASIAARCAADQGKFWEYQAELFENQPELRDTSNLPKFAGELDLDVEQFEQCLDSDKHNETIARGLFAGQQAGVSGTPAFFINGIMLSGAQPPQAFEEIIESELERAG